jgi:hypothetical protein
MTRKASRNTPEYADRSGALARPRYLSSITALVTDQKKSGDT